MMIGPYSPPRSAHAIDLKLDANEGRPPPAILFDSLARVGVDSLRRYPSTLDLERKIAARLDIPAARVIVTAGGDDALDRICRAFLASRQTAVMTAPTFEMIPRYVVAAGADPLQIPWADGAFPLSAFLGQVENAALSFVVTPNNPTGAVATADDIRAISQAAGDRPVCVDLAYTEYAETDLTPQVLNLPNAVIIRTFSKAWGLAGIRVGYAVAPERFATRIRHAGSPYAVAAPSIAIASEWLDRGEAHMRESVSLARRERAALTYLLRSLGVQAVTSQANFVLARLPDAWGVAGRLAERGIGVRRFAAASPLADSLRITCPCDGASFDRLQSALRDILAPELRS